MSSLDKPLLLAATVVLLGGVVWLLFRSVQTGRLATRGMLAPLLIAFLLQGAGLLARGHEVGGCPVGNKFEVFHYISWCLVGVTLLLGRSFRHSLPGALAAGVAASLGLAAHSVPAWDATRTGNVLGPNPWIESHAALAVTSYGLLAVLAVASAVQLHQYYGLKSRRPRQPAGLLPSLQELDRLTFRLLFAAAALLTVSVAIGAVFFKEHPEAVTAEKLLAVVPLWLGAVAVLVLRALRKLPGARLSWVSIALFLAAIATLWPLHFGEAQPASPMPTDGGDLK